MLESPLSIAVGEDGELLVAGWLGNLISILKLLGQCLSIVDQALPRLWVKVVYSSSDGFLTRLFHEEQSCQKKCQRTCSTEQWCQEKCHHAIPLGVL